DVRRGDGRIRRGPSSIARAGPSQAGARCACGAACRGPRRHSGAAAVGRRTTRRAARVLRRLLTTLALALLAFATTVAVAALSLRRQRQALQILQLGALEPDRGLEVLLAALLLRCVAAVLRVLGEQAIVLAGSVDLRFPLLARLAFEAQQPGHVELRVRERLAALAQQLRVRRGIRSVLGCARVLQLLDQRRQVGGRGRQLAVEQRSLGALELEAPLRQRLVRRQLLQRLVVALDRLAPVLVLHRGLGAGEDGCDVVEHEAFLSRAVVVGEAGD